jgi:hypothetical protein
MFCTVLVILIMVTVVVYYIFCLLFTKGVALLALVFQIVQDRSGSAIAIGRRWERD